MNESSKNWVLAAIVALVLIIGGIFVFTSSSDEEDEVANVDSSQVADQSESQAQEQATIVELAQATPELSTLVTTVVAADLVDTLNSDGPFTVFAPTDSAFAALPDGTLDDLLKPENVDQLTEILTYHVVAGEAFSTDLTDGQKIETVQGEELTVSIKDGKVMINNAEVLTADVDASNGVVHVIDTVLLP